MRTGTPLQPDKCFICSLCHEHTHALDTIRLFLDPQTLPLIKILICRTIKKQWTDTWCTASACLFRFKDKNGRWQNYRCHFPYNDRWRVSHRARSCASDEITLTSLYCRFSVYSEGSLPNSCLFMTKYVQPGPTHFQ